MSECARISCLLVIEWPPYLEGIVRCAYDRVWRPPGAFYDAVAS